MPSAEWTAAIEELRALQILFNETCDKIIKRVDGAGGVPEVQSRLMSEIAAANYLSVSHSFLQKRRQRQQDAPAYTLKGNRPYYRQIDLDAWLIRQSKTSERENIARPNVVRLDMSKYFRPAEVARLLGLTESELRKFRIEGDCPRFRAIGSQTSSRQHVLYERKSTLEWGKQKGFL